MRTDEKRFPANHAASLMALLLLALPAAAQAQFTFTTNNGTITITVYNYSRTCSHSHVVTGEIIHSTARRSPSNDCTL
jgi:type 1 fimbria pilin